jgi:hypothetical protein
VSAVTVVRVVVAGERGRVAAGADTVRRSGTSDSTGFQRDLLRARAVSGV